MGPIGLMGLMGLMGCSEDSGDSKDSLGGTSVEVMGFAADYQEVVASTRGWLPPTGFSIPEGAEQGIGYCFTQNGQDPSDMQGAFFKSSSGWRSTVDIAAKMTAGSTYYLYGYTPSTGVTCTITDLAGTHANFSEGAILTLDNLPCASGSDVCVAVGAKNGRNDYRETGDYSVTGLCPGDFAYTAHASGSDGGGNYVYLLFDHLYAALRINMKVDGEYDQLRKIKLKGIKLGTRGEGGETKNIRATITLTANTDGSDPITSIAFVQTGSVASSGSISLPAGGEDLTTSFKTFQGYFMPEGVTSLIVTSRYDVYDTNNNLIRQNCEATNTIPLDLFPYQEQFSRGTCYTVNMTIQPTYLYMLSEPDLDSPTLTINH